jgi:thiol-disulfide isomerase/thioredoxin
MPRQRLAVLLVALGVTVAALPCLATDDDGGQARAQAAGASLIGSNAPALELKTIDGQSINLGSLYGHKAVYLEFWATWCVPCRQQMPHLKRTYESAGSNLAVIAVNAGFNDALQDVEAYRKAVGLRMPIVIDDGRLADALHLRVTPQHIVIARDGRVIYVGHLADSTLDAAIEAARTEPVKTVLVRRTTPSLAQTLGIGAEVPTAALKGPGGAQLPLRDPDGKRKTVLMFMSPWCESYYEKSRPQRSRACREAREQSETMARSQGVRWVGIASGLWAATEDLSEYRADAHVTVPLSLDEKGTIFRQFGVKDVPTFIVVDADGRVTARIDGMSDDWQTRIAAATK